MSKYKLNTIYWIIKIDNIYELLFSYLKNGIHKYGIITSTVDLTYLVDLPELIFQYRFIIVEDFSYIMYRYTNTIKSSIKEFRYGNGEIIVTDYENFLYYRNIDSINNNIITINAGNKKVPDLIEVEVIRYPVLLNIPKGNSCIEIYKLRDNITVLHNTNSVV